MIFERLIWIVPVAVAGAGLWRPRAGLLVLAATLPFFGSPPGGPYLAALDVAAIAAIVTAWRGGRAEPSPVGWPAAAFIAVSLLSIVPSPYQPPGWQISNLAGLLAALPGVETWSALYTWRAAADLILGWVLFLAVRRAYAGRSPIPLARAFLAGLVAVVLLGIASASGLVELGGYRPRHEPLLDVPRLYSVFFLSGWLAEYLVLVTPVALAALVEGPRWGRRLATPLAALVIACLGLTMQRGSWVAAVAMLISAAILAVRRFPIGRRRLLTRVGTHAGVLVLLAGLALVAAETPVDQVADRIESIGVGGLSGRIPQWAAASELTRQRPVLGWGLGSFAPAYDLAHPPGSPGASPWRNTAHSLYLNVTAERGLLGLVALGLLAWAIAVGLTRPRADREALTVGLATSFVGALAYGLVQYLFHLRSISWMLWILLACVALATRAEAHPASGRIARALLVLCLLLLPWRAFFVQPPPLAGSGVFGLHEPESDSTGQRYRWTEGAAAMRIPWIGETIVLTLANGHPRAAQRPVDVEVAIDGRPVANLTITGGWEEHAIPVGPASQATLTLGLRARPPFRPFSDFRGDPELQPSLDIRSLGIAVREPGWLAPASAPP